ncbi:hypothetical protein SNE40_004421 [Patella caerulea]|uniref:Uncharacterized protein n=1 Tax=Patella caerulea TaxID=87958 RepID=A0AAN8K2X6_PATCE
MTAYSSSLIFIFVAIPNVEVTATDETPRRITNTGISNTTEPENKSFSFTMVLVFTGISVVIVLTCITVLAIRFAILIRSVRNQPEHVAREPFTINGGYCKDDGNGRKTKASVDTCKQNDICLKVTLSPCQLEERQMIPETIPEYTEEEELRDLGIKNIK